MVEIVLAGRPMGKERVRRGAGGRAYTPERTVAFEGRLALEAQRAMAGRPLLDGALSVEVVAVFPVPASKPARWRRAALAGEILPTGKPDADNVLKLCDGLNMVVWRDDAQVVRASVAKVYGERPMFAVRVKPIDGRPALPAWAAKHTADAELFD